MKKAIYAGSFDPITFGHIDIINRASTMFDELTIAVIHNPDKQALFSIEERTIMIRSLFDSESIRVDSFKGLMVDFVREKHIYTLVRGLRAVSDFDYEFQMALTNRQLESKLETVFLMTASEYSYLSSSLVKQLASYQEDVSSFVPKIVSDRLKENMSEILGILETLEVLVNDAKPVPFSKKVMVNQSRLLELIDKLKFVSKRMEIEAVDATQNVMDNRAATDEFNPAKDSAVQMVVLAKQEAKEIRHSAAEYADNVLSKLQLLVTKMQKNLHRLEDNIKNGRLSMDENLKLNQENDSVLSEIRQEVLQPQTTLKIERNYTRYAPGSVLISCGETRVLCTATVEESVPRFLRDSGQGWLTAEYSMLPSATHTRVRREVQKGHCSGRTSEIQRLIGRSLRAIVDLEKLGERSITIDCDVLQADGGTRTASISGAMLALHDAVSVLIQDGLLQESPITSWCAAVSVGIVDGQPLLDLNYDEDSSADVDMNVVMTESGQFIEVQGTAEHHPFSKSEMDIMLELAQDGILGIISDLKADL